MELAAVQTVALDVAGERSLDELLSRIFEGPLALMVARRATDPSNLPDERKKP